MSSRRYAVFGALFGLGFPVLGTLLEALTTHGNVPFVDGLIAAQGTPILWVADMGPLILALVAGLVGRRQDEVQALEAAERARFEATASEVSRSAQALLDAVSRFSAMSVQTSTAVRETTGTMQHLGNTATQAALTAETVVGLTRSARSVLGEVQQAALGSGGIVAPTGTLDAPLKKLLAAIDDTKGAATAIAKMALEQDRGIDAALKAMNEIHFATEELTSSTQAVAAQAKSLTNLAIELKRSVAS